MGFLHLPFRALAYSDIHQRRQPWQTSVPHPDSATYGTLECGHFVGQEKRLTKATHARLLHTEFCYRHKRPLDWSKMGML